MWGLPERSTGVFSDRAVLEPLVPDGVLQVGAPVNDPDPLTVYSTTEEIVRICPNGDVLWRGRLVESDDDFKKAMLDMADTLKNIYTKGNSL